MDPVRITRQVALYDRSATTASDTLTQALPAAPRTPPPAARPAAAPPRPAPQAPAPRPGYLVPVGQEAARRPNLSELSIRAVEQMRRNGQLPAANNARPSPVISRAAQQAFDLAEAPTNPRTPTRPVSAQPGEATPQSEAGRPTKELKPPPGADPHQALDVLKQAVSQLPPQAPAHQALADLAAFVNKTQPQQEDATPNGEQPRQPLGEDKPREEQQQPPPQQEQQQQAPPDPFAGRVLKAGPRFAVDRFRTALQAAVGTQPPPPGIALDLQG